MEDIRRPMRRRRMSAPPPRPLPARLPPCRPLPLSLEALDLSPASPAQALASLRFLVLSYLADLERRLSLFESAEWAEAALDMLHGIRADVRSHLPDLGAHLPDMDLKSHLPDMDFIAHLPDMDLKSLMQRWAELDFSRPLSYVPTLSARLSTLRAELAARRPSFEFDFDFDFPTPSFDFDYHSYFARPSFPFSPPARLASFLTELDAFLAELPRLPSLALSLPDLPSLSPCSALPSPFPFPEHNEEEAVARALQLSAHGAHLITYADLPPAWQNNAFVRKGYRFVPLRRWYALVGSVFRLHNETLNIHTHLIPLVLWGAALAGAVWPTPFALLHRLLSTPTLAAFAPLASAAGAFLGWLPIPRDAGRYTPFSSSSSSSFPYSPSASSTATPSPPDGTETLFTLFALACLASSALWHTMAGCAGRRAMEACARVDYVGIGWLIATSIATVVHHGYACAEAAAEATPLGHAVLHPSTLLQSGGVLEAALQHTSELLHVHSHSGGGGEVAGGSSFFTPLTPLFTPLSALFTPLTAFSTTIKTLLAPLTTALRSPLETAAYHPLGSACLLLCLACGVSGNVLPYCAWFNRVENRLWRLGFFVGISFSALAPLAGIAALQGWGAMVRFVAPVGPSLLFYIVGIVIYATQVPERWIGGGARGGEGDEGGSWGGWRAKLGTVVDYCGGGSHALWHVCIVLAMRAHRDGIREMRAAAAAGGCAAAGHGGGGLVA